MLWSLFGLTSGFCSNQIRKKPLNIDGKKNMMRLHFPYAFCLEVANCGVGFNGAILLLSLIFLCINFSLRQ